MMRSVITVLAFLALVACSNPDRYTGKDCQRQGGIGGTGECGVDE